MPGVDQGQIVAPLRWREHPRLRAGAANKRNGRYTCNASVRRLRIDLGGHRVLVCASASTISIPGAIQRRSPSQASETHLRRNGCYDCYGILGLCFTAIGHGSAARGRTPTHRANDVVSRIACRKSILRPLGEHFARALPNSVQNREGAPAATRAPPTAILSILPESHPRNGLPTSDREARCRCGGRYKTAQEISPTRPRRARITSVGIAAKQQKHQQRHEARSRHKAPEVFVER